MENNWTKIEAYFNGTLDDQERKKLEEKMKTDKDFAQEVELYKDIEGGLRLKGNKALKKQLEDIHQRVRNKSRQGQIRSLAAYRVATIAAAIALLILAGYFLLKPAAPGHLDLFAQNYESYEWNLNTRGENPDATLRNLNQLYQSKAYQQLISEIESLNPNLEQDARLTMALGTAYLSLDEYDKAIQHFQTASDNALLQSEANWNIALTYLKSGNTEKAISHLTTIAETTSDLYAQKAKELLKKLN